MIDYRLLIIDYFVEIALRCWFKLGLIGVNRQHGQDKKSEKLGLIGFELGLNWV